MDEKTIPMTKTDFVKQGRKWVAIHTEEELISLRQAGWVLGNAGLPFEKSHRLYKKDKYRHSHSYDTFESISPDGLCKSRWYVRFAEAK